MGTRIRNLAERITNDAAKVYSLYGIDMNPKWFPVFYCLTQQKESSISKLANEIGHSHVSVSKIVKEMTDHKLIISKTAKNDKRQNLISLSKKGLRFADKIEAQYSDVRSALELINENSTQDLWESLKEWEYHLEQKSFYERVLESKKQRQSDEVIIRDYRQKDRADFRNLNIAWIGQYFKMEEADFKALDNPEQYILKRGGHILVATIDDNVVGVCALLKRDDLEYPYELAKMAVSRDHRGKGIGVLLGQSIIEKANSLGVKTLYLESNTILTPAIKLYRKLGFEKVVGKKTPYERCNIQMEKKLR